MAFTGMCVTLKDGQTVLFPECPGWTQAINTLGLAANPDAGQLSVEAPGQVRTTRSDKRRVNRKNKVESVYVFKVGGWCVVCALVVDTHLKLFCRAGSDRQAGYYQVHNHGSNSQPTQVTCVEHVTTHTTKV